MLLKVTVPFCTSLLDNLDCFSFSDMLSIFYSVVLDNKNSGGLLEKSSVRIPGSVLLEHHCIYSPNFERVVAM